MRVTSSPHRMIDMLEGAGFDNRPINEPQADALVNTARALIASLP